MGRRILNRKDLRADFDAAERRKQDDEEVDEEEGEEEEDEDEDEEAEGDEEEAAETDEEEEKVVVKKKKPAPKPAKPAKAAKPKSRSRSAKVTRMRVVWGVFNNSNQRVASFDYPKRKDADDLATKLTTDKKQTHFVQPVKEPFEEKAKE